MEQKTVLARRHSHDKTPLRQVELVFHPRTNGTRAVRPGSNAKRNDLVTKATISEFERALPHTLAPYIKRNWGHPPHSLSSYQGKLKPSLAHWLVQRFTDKSALVLDPLGGVGTIAFEAALQGRRSISSDLSPFPAMVALPSWRRRTRDELVAALNHFAKELRITRVSAADLSEAEFGLNATVRDYYHPRHTPRSDRRKKAPSQEVQPVKSREISLCVPASHLARQSALCAIEMFTPDYAI